MQQALTHFGERDRCYLVVALNTGYRISELLSLRVGDVWDRFGVRSQLTVERRFMKGGRGRWKKNVRSRIIDLNPEATAALQRYLRWRVKRNGGTPPHPDEPLFASRIRGRAMSRWQANRVVHVTLDRAGIEDRGRFCTHTLRKTFAARIYRELGYDIVATCAAMGHAQINTTHVYLEADRERIRDAFYRIGDGKPRAGRRRAA